MLTDLNFLNRGQPWPPECEKDRMRMYWHNKNLFENDHAVVYKRQFQRIERIIGNFQEVVSYPVVANFQKLLSLKVADLLLGEPPNITAGESDSDEQKSVDQIIENADLINTAYEIAIDVSRYGDGLFYVYESDGSGLIDASQPPIWFPVVEPDNIKKTQYQVLAWTFQQNASSQTKHLKIRIYEKTGRYFERVHEIQHDKIGRVIVEEKTYETKLDDFPVIQVPNVMTSDRVHGMDDYTDIDSVISELLVRVGQISRVLDKHAAPSIEGPATALEKDPVTGEWHLKMGGYFPRNDKEDAETKYIVWDANMDANFKMIEKLVNFLHVISEMGPALLSGEDMKTGQATSGTALRMRMISPLAKVSRIAMRFGPALKKAIRLCSKLGGNGIVDLSGVPISITWHDGLPNDPKEDAEIMDIRTGSKPTMSQKRAIKSYDGLNDEDAENELQQIQEEEAKANPIAGGNFPFGNKDPGGDE